MSFHGIFLMQPSIKPVCCIQCNVVGVATDSDPFCSLTCYSNYIDEAVAGFTDIDEDLDYIDQSDDIPF